MFLSSSPQDGLRVAAGGCIGSLALVAPEAELETIVNKHLIGLSFVSLAGRLVGCCKLIT